MSDVHAVKVRNGIFSLYDETGDFIGRVDTDTGRALIGDAFYVKERTERLEYDEIHGCNVCTGCGERYEYDKYIAHEYDKYIALTDDYPFIAFKPMRFCPNCGVRFKEDDDGNE